jgi:uroporphyrinogen decarboxylase
LQSRASGRDKPKKTDMISATARRLLPDAPLLVAAQGERPNRVPVWFMRQAGRSLPEYREVPLHAAGVGLDIVPGTGPVVESPVRSASDVAALPTLEPEAVEPVAAAVRLLVAELGQVPLIGFAGAPFTLASYLIEGAPAGTTNAVGHGVPPQTAPDSLTRVVELAHSP